MTYKRVVNVDSGTAMIVTDLHGHGETFDRIKAIFLRGLQTGKMDRLIIAGDLIHGYGREDDDDSLRMLLNVIEMQEQLGSDKVVMLLGNHEMPHIYSVPLTKGNIEFSPRFEHALTQSDAKVRDSVLSFLRSLPFYVSTAAGVLITHAGASDVINSVEMAEYMLNFDHDALLALADARIERAYSRAAVEHNETYRYQAKYQMGITDTEDRRFLHLLRGQILSQTVEEYSDLWDLLFTSNERETSLKAYDKLAADFLKVMSQVCPHEQRVLVAGHIGVDGGYELVGTKQLRLASYAHAYPPEDGAFLLLDCAAPVQTPDDLVPMLRRVYF